MAEWEKMVAARKVSLCVYRHTVCQVVAAAIEVRKRKEAERASKNDAEAPSEEEVQEEDASEMPLDELAASAFMVNYTVCFLPGSPLTINLLVW